MNWKYKVTVNMPFDKNIFTKKMYISIQQLSVTHLYKSHDSGLNLQVLQQTVSVLFLIIFNF